MIKKEEMVEMVLNAYMDEEQDSGRFTSQDICDNLRETISLSTDEVSGYLMSHGYSLEGSDDRLVWVKM